jgi:hypothetical protein
MAPRPRSIRQRRVLDLRDVEVWVAGEEDSLGDRPQAPRTRIDRSTLVSLKHIAKVESVERGERVNVAHIVEEALLSFVIAWVLGSASASMTSERRDRR